MRPRGGNQQGVSPQTKIGIGVTVGVFTVPDLDFGAGAIDGAARWLEIEVKCPPDAVFTLLFPRVKLTPAPHAIRASEGVGPPNALEVDTVTGNIGIGGPSTGVARRLELAGPAPLRMAMRRSDNPIAAGGIEFLGSAGDVAWVVGTNISYGLGFEINSGTINENVIYITPAGAVFISGNVGPGIPPDNQGANLRVYGPMRADLVQGNTIQILGGADIAEPFMITPQVDSTPIIEPGMIVIIDSKRPGNLELASTAYDRKVAGVISGANGLSPGMVLKSEGHLHADGDHNVALTGRVWCWCDASFGEIEPGDRLTTSNTPGHAMKVTDNERAIGAVIGKAMTPLKEGRGLVLVLVQPQ